MKKQRSLVVMMTIASMLSATIPQGMVFAAELVPTSVENQFEEAQGSLRYTYLSRVTLSATLRDGGASYNLYVKGISDVERISGWATLYKKSSSGSYYEVSSESFSKSTNDLSWHSVLPTDGSGTYRLEVDGTAYTSNDSEDFFTSINRSY